MNRLHVIILMGLAAVDLAAGFFALNAWIGPADDAAAIARAFRPLTLPAVEEPPEVDLGPDAETLARPLFVKSRRPSSAGQRESAGNGTSPTDLKLRAIVAMNQTMRVYLVVNGAAEGKWFGVGDEIGLWAVESISPTQVALRRDTQTVVIGFDYTPIFGGAVFDGGRKIIE